MLSLAPRGRGAVPGMVLSSNIPQVRGACSLGAWGDMVFGSARGGESRLVWEHPVVRRWSLDHGSEAGCLLGESKWDQSFLAISVVNLYIILNSLRPHSPFFSRA